MPPDWKPAPGALGALKLAGASYLVYIGLKPWLSTTVRAPEPAAARRGGLYREGLLVALSNPKAMLFVGFALALALSR